MKQGKKELNPSEKIIFDKYGKQGLTIYELIDGETATTEILTKVGLTPPKLVEILDFMNEQGIIQLNYPKSNDFRL